MTTLDAIPELSPGRAGRRLRVGQVDVRRAALRPIRGDLQRLLPRPGRRRRERPGGHRRTRSRCCTSSPASGSPPAGSPSSTRPTCSRDARAQVVELARAHDVLPVAIVLDVPEERVRGTQRAAAPTATSARTSSAGSATSCGASLRGLAREGFRKVHVLRGRRGDRRRHASSASGCSTTCRDEHGPFDVIGDVHGCRAELEALLGRAGLRARRATTPGAPVDAAPPGRPAGGVRRRPGRPRPGHARRAAPGDGHGRGRATPLRARATTSTSWCARCAGAKVQVTPRPGGDARAARRARPPEFRAAGRAVLLRAGRRTWCSTTAGWSSRTPGSRRRYHGRASGRVRSFALYGDTTGETDEFGLPVRYPWADDYRGRAMVLYGHTPIPEPEWVNNTMCLDTGCVFGGALTALRYPEKELVSVPAEQVWYEPAKPFPAATAPTAATRRASPTCSTSTTCWAGGSIETAHHGRITIREENAAGALEVMSRFALHPRWLLLPAADDGAGGDRRRARTCWSTPTEAFAAYRAAGVAEVICEEKHMGSRAVVARLPRRRRRRAPVRRARRATGAVLHPHRPAVLRRPDAHRALAGAAARGGRRGRAVGRARHRLAAARRRAAAVVAPRPRSCSATSTRRRRGGAGRAARPRRRRCGRRPAAASTSPSCWPARTARAANAEAFTAAYRRYCWPTDGLDGVAAGAVPGARHRAAHATTTGAHGWHLDIADRLRRRRPDAGRADPPARRRHRPTRRRSRPGSAWWDELTAAGGEGMVVKPLANLTRGRKGLVQPGLKVRGREYLRHHLRPRLHRAGQPGPAAASATSATSGRSRCASTRSGWRRWTGWPAASRCGGCTRPSSPCSRWSRSRSTPGCDAFPCHAGHTSVTFAVRCRRAGGAS